MGILHGGVSSVFETATAIAESQIYLLVLWAVLPRVRLLIRSIFALLMAILVFLCAVDLPLRHSVTNAPDLVSLSFWIAEFLVALMIALAGAHVLDMRLVLIRPDTKDRLCQGRPFGLRSLFVFVALTALICAALRSGNWPNWFSAIATQWRHAGLAHIVAGAGFSMASLALARSILSPPKPMPVVSALLWMIGSVLSAILVTEMLIFRLDWRQVSLAVEKAAVMLGSIAFSTWLVRRAGYRVAASGTWPR